MDLKSIAAMFHNASKRGTLSHAYLFWGHGEAESRLDAALSVARIFETEPFIDCMIIRPEGNEIGIDAARAASRFLSQKPFRSARKTVVIAGAAAMNRHAQNAFLKTVEEPAPHGLILATVRDAELLIPALRSRFQKIYIPSEAENRKLKTANSDAELARAFIAGNAASRKDILKKLVETEDIPAFDRFAAAVMALLDRDPARNLSALRELSRRIVLMAEHPANRRLQWEAVLSYL